MCKEKEKTVQVREIEKRCIRKAWVNKRRYVWVK